MLLAAATGHQCLGTIHSDSPRGALWQLATFARLAPEGVKTEALADMIAEHFDLVLVCQIGADGSRKVSHIFEITGRGADDVIDGSDLWELDSHSGDLVPTGVSARRLSRFARRTAVSAGGIVGLALAMLFAFGALLLYVGLTSPAAAPARVRRKLAAAEARLRVFLRAAGLEMDVRTFVLYSCGCGLGSAALAQAVLGWPVTTVLAFGLGSGALAILYSPRAARRRAAERAALPEFAEQLRSGIGAGQLIEQGLVKLAATGREALRPELLRLVLRHQVGDFETALREFRDRLGDPLADEFVAALVPRVPRGREGDRACADQAGGGDASAARLETRSHGSPIPCSTYGAHSHGRTSRDSGGHPPISPDYLAVYDGPLGQLMLLGCFVW